MKNCITFLSIFFITVATAQLDKENKSVKIPVVEAEDAKKETVESPIKIGTETDTKAKNYGLTKTDDAKVNGLSVSRRDALNASPKPFSIVGGERFGNPGEQYEHRISKHLKSIDKQLQREPQRYGATTDQFLGDFRSHSKTMRIVYRDHEYPDGDRIRVLINDQVVQANILLTPSFNGFVVDLQPGFNKIDFFALNQGESGPNTAEFKIIDENGFVISSNQWNLATGVKATVIVVKEDSSSNSE